MNFKLHPVVQLFEPLPPEKRAKLKDAIRLHGANVVLWNDQIVYGRHHAEICQELGVEVPTGTRGKGDRGELFRRNLRRTSDDR